MLSLGVAIFNHTWQSDSEVHVVLMTEGKASNAYNVLTGDVYCRVHNKYHDPTKEGYKGFTRDDFGAARVDEFKYSVMLLGVDPENIHTHDLGDGNVTVKEAKDLMSYYNDKYPGSRFKTFTYHDDHNDHKNAGKALNELHNEGKIEDARFYIQNRNYYDDLDKGIETPGRKEKYSKEYRPFIDAAIASYSKWTPKTGSFGIGYHSVKKDFELLKEKPISIYHLPNE